MLDEEKLLNIRVTLACAPGGMAHFTPGQTLRWGRCKFSINPSGEGDWDFWIVFANAIEIEKANVAPGNTLFIAAEPPAKKTYPRRFYRQFAHVVDTHNGSRHPNLEVGMLGMFWMVGLNWDGMNYEYGYDFLSEMPRPKKQNKVSVVCSSTAKTEGQKARLRFLEALKKELGDDLVHFGKGFELIDDKMDAISPYRFNLVLENSQSPHYWTEKLTDAYLGWAFPFYVGCPNVDDYFSSESFHAIDMGDVSRAAKEIRGFLSRPESAEEVEAINEARHRVLNPYNPFSRFDHWVNKFHKDGEKRYVTIETAKRFRILRGPLRKLFAKKYIKENR